MTERRRPAGTPGRPSRLRLRPLLLVTTVGVAFADSSIVVLAVPQLLGTVSRSVAAVSWVVTAFNLAVAVVAAGLLARTPRRVRALAVAGEAAFVAGSLVCALSPGLGLLVAGRSLQGVGAALLLSSSVPLLAGLTGSARRAALLWSAAAAVGAAAGPAVGGVLTQLFSWRAIFVAQLPPAALALVAVLVRAPRADPGPAAAPQEPADPTPGPPGGPAAAGRSWPARGSLALVSGALVGSLFLVVVLLIDVWDLTPIRAAAVVSVLPVGTLLVRPVAHHLGWRRSSVTGCVVMGCSLTALGALQGHAVGPAVAALGAGGAGMGLAVTSLTERHVATAGDSLRSAAGSVAIRHAGLVVALLVGAPLLGADLAHAKSDATVRAADRLLAAPLPPASKYPLAFDLGNAVRDAPSNRAPQLQPVFDRHGARTDPGVRRLGTTLEHDVEDTLTVSFHRTFVFCAALAALAALLALVPGTPSGGPRRRVRPREWRDLAAVALAVAGLATVAVAALAGPARVAAPPADHPCADREPATGSAVTDVALAALSDAGCRLHLSRGRVLLVVAGVDRSAAGRVGAGRVDAAVRAALVASLRAEAARFTPYEQRLFLGIAEHADLSVIVGQLAAAGSP